MFHVKHRRVPGAVVAPDTANRSNVDRLGRSVLNGRLAVDAHSKATLYGVDHVHRNRGSGPGRAHGSGPDRTDAVSAVAWLFFSYAVLAALTIGIMVGAALPQGKIPSWLTTGDSDSHRE